MVVNNKYTIGPSGPCTPISPLSPCKEVLTSLHYIRKHYLKELLNIHLPLSLGVHPCLVLLSRLHLAPPGANNVIQSLSVGGCGQV